jgi:hypothetical protein
MALVIVHIQDDEAKGVAVHVYGEPLPQTLAGLPPEHFTPAQRLGAIVLNAISEEMEQAAPKILVAGADEMPYN